MERRMARKPPARPSLDLARRQAAPAAPGENRLAGAREVLVTQLVPDPDQPRRTFPADTLAELAASITQRGVLQALLVRMDGVGDDGLTRYAIIDGERRWRAARLAGRDRLPVLVRDEDDSETVRVLQIIANVQREDLDPIEEAVSFRDIMQGQGLSTRALGALIGRNHMHVQRRLDLLYDERLTDAVRTGRLNASTAHEVKSLPDDAREEALTRIAAGAAFDVAAVRTLKRGPTRPARSRMAPPDDAPSAPHPMPSHPVHGPEERAVVPVPTVTNRYSGEAAVEDPGEPRGASTRVTHRDKADVTAPPSAPVSALYSGFQDWRVRTYDALPRLTAVEVETLARLLRGDIEQLWERLNDAARRATD